MKSINYAIAALLVVIVILAVFLFDNIKARNDSDESVRYLHQSADNALRYQLSIVAASFGTDLDEDEDGFNACQAAVSAAAALSPLTTFEARNDLIDVVLDRFGKMLNNPSNRETVIHQAPALRQIFMKLNRDPADVETTKRLSDLADSLKF
ncbi:hypothetical protein GZH47_13000 [Paenibacillus rhizovicinus]|uniref:DUF4363 family protein n=1 Tax=Paenibacillus rhizovicinus TaxID=2704463 RepID=A0A6C0NZP5_9BACL|nr:hypothetical protein [Paenibacillus rhizovicinus]QHW31669.1 hypothetical protein GZH47_13000 [Paenibacillus rhizovicinus]